MSSNGRGSLFEFVVLYHPKKTKGSKQAKSEIVVDLQRTVAKGEQEAVILASRLIPDEYTDKLEDVEIAIRPF